MLFKQSFAYWCLADSDWHWNTDQICQAAVNLGLDSIELAPPDTYPALQKNNLKCALCFNGMPGAPFVKGFNNLAHHEELIARTRNSIDQASHYGFPNVIAFTGFKWNNPEDPHSGEISLTTCLTNCVQGLSELSSYAASRNVTIVLEHLNTRDNTHPMKGHPGYQGDNIDFCAEIIRRVNSPSVRLLFDFYHVQIMHGDLIRRIYECRDVIGHIHTAGCPGRNEFDDTQEIHYPAVAAALRALNYQGYVGHEFIPKRNPTNSIAEAMAVFNPPLQSE